MSTGIDAKVVLGLAGKAAQVFAEPRTYLSFPLAPVPIERSRLRALATDPMSPLGQQALAEFSLLVSELADGPLWQPDGDQRLWDVYGDVLAGAELAEGTRTVEEEADYQRAYRLLYETQPDGDMVDSPFVVAYEQYRDAYVAAVQEYNNRKGQAEPPTDAAVREQWAKDEAALRERVTRAEQDWASAGRRAEVDDARRLLRELGSRSPLMVWAGYRKLFDPDLPEIFFRTAPDGSMYVPSAFVPSDIVDAAWPTITVTRADLAALAAAAPEGLRSRLSGSSGDTAVDWVSFEYSSVAVQRPWFAPEVFASRAWRFYDSARVLSDGGTPPAGECTAYVSGLVLARNISVRRQATGTPPPSLGFLPTTRPIAQASIVRPQPAAVVIARAHARSAAVTGRTAAPGATLAAAKPTLGITLPGIARPPTVSGGVPGGGGAVHVVKPDPAVSRIPAIIRIPGVRPPILSKPPTVPPAAGGATTTIDPNYIYLLAFICRLLPKSPNPDPALNW
jgi:hypothetical protein